MAEKRFSWAYPAVVLLAACSLTGAVLHPRFRQNNILNHECSSAQTGAAANDPNAPDPEQGVPTLNFELQDR